MTRTIGVSPKSNDRLARKKPQILIHPNLVRVTDLAERAIARAGGIFQRGSALVHIARPGARTPAFLRKLRITPPSMAPSIEIVGRDLLRERLARAADWLVRKGKKTGLALPPLWAVDSLAARGDWPLPHLEALVEVPSMRSDGTILDSPGYDRATGIYFEPHARFPRVQATPSHADAKAAIETLLDLVADFPFVASSDRSSAIASMLTMAARTAIPGPTPLFASRAPTPGTGKGRLIDSSSLAMSGRMPTLMSASSSEEEWRKRLFAIGMAGCSIVLFDNINGRFGGESLAAALTTCSITDRMLGASRIVTAPLMPTWTLTGNNTVFTDDMGRRVLPCDLDAMVERPEERTGWRHPDILDYARRSHPRLLVAALTVLRAFVVAGKPSHGRPKMGSFEAWDDLVRGAILWLQHPDLTDPLDGRDRVRRDSDADVAILRQVLFAWFAAFGSRPSPLASALDYARRSDPSLLAAFAQLDHDGRRVDTNALGYRFRKWKGRPVDGLRLESLGTIGGVSSWRVAPVSP